MVVVAMYQLFLFAGGSVHGATVIVSWTLRVVKLFSVLIVLVATTQVTIKLYDDMTQQHTWTVSKTAGQLVNGRSTITTYEQITK